MANGGLACIATSVAAAKKLTDKAVHPLGFGEVNIYYHGSLDRPVTMSPGFGQRAPEALGMAGVLHKDMELFEPCDDYPMVVPSPMEGHGFPQISGQTRSCLKRRRAGQADGARVERVETRPHGTVYSLTGVYAITMNCLDREEDLCR